MKLKNLAALIFRVLGASYLVMGIADLAEVFGEGHDLVMGLIGQAGMSLLGYLLIRYSKQLGQLFCRGLED